MATATMAPTIIPTFAPMGSWSHPDDEDEDEEVLLFVLGLLLVLLVPVLSVPVLVPPSVDEVSVGVDATVVGSPA